MPPGSAFLDTTVRAAVLRHLARNTMGGGGPGVGLSVLDALMADVSTRDQTYLYTVELCESDPAKRSQIAELLTTYVVGFSPSDAVLDRIWECCEKFGGRVENAGAFSGLESALTAVRDVAARRAGAQHSSCTGGDGPSAAARGDGVATATGAEASPSSTAPDGFRGPTAAGAGDNASRSGFHYLQQQPMLPAVRDRNRRAVAIVCPTPKETTAVANEKNREVLEQFPLCTAYSLVRCKDYVDQQPLPCTESLLDHQLRILTMYVDHYRTHPLVTKATSFLIKVWCDAYASKVPLLTGVGEGEPHRDAPREQRQQRSFLRFVTASFASVLLPWMTSEYYCVRHHVYDVVLTLSVHLQLVDSQPAVTNLPELLQEEMVWLMRMLLRRQASLEITEDRVVMAALKCTLVVVPTTLLYSLDARVLKQFLSLPALGETQPHIQVLLTEALATRLLGRAAANTGELGGVPVNATNAAEQQRADDPASSGKPGGNAAVPVTRWAQLLDAERGGIPPIDERDLYKETGWSIDDVVHLYHQCASGLARQHIFCVLFSLAAFRASAKGDRQPSPQLVAVSAKAVLDLGLSWELRALTVYLSHRTARELPAHINVDLGVKQPREVKLLVLAVVQQLTWLIDRFCALPHTAAKLIAAAAGDSAPAEHLRRFATGAAECIAALARDDTGASHTSVATTLLFQTLRLLRVQQTGLLLPEATQLVNAVAGHSSAKVRGILPKAIGALWLLCRTQPQQALAPLQLCLKTYLQRETSVPALLRLYQFLAEGMSAEGGSVASAASSSLEGDISWQLMHGARAALLSSAEMIGQRNLWTLYWGLRPSSLLSACRARFILVSLLSAMHSSSGVTAASATITSGTSSSVMGLGGGAAASSSSSALVQVTLWAKIMSDPYPPAALVGAHKVIRISGLSAYDKYEAAISEAQRAANTSALGNAYTMACSIWLRILADTPCAAFPLPPGSGDGGVL